MLHSISEQLQEWSIHHFGKRKEEVAGLMSELHQFKSSNLLREECAEIKRVEMQIDHILQDEEIYWKQRSRVSWLQAGDKNTKFFHAFASERKRKRKNRIEGMLQESGEWTYDQNEVEHLICNYFQNLFSTTQPHPSTLEEATRGLSKKISEDHCRWLSAPFLREEVEVTLRQIHLGKASGPDGFPAAFLQKHWHIIGEEVTSTCLSILNEQGDIFELNYTFIVLIPKCNTPAKITDFRPISLCNVIYRLMAKVIANRLKCTLDQIISPNQSAFVPSRLITDNIIVGYECLHKIRKRRKGKQGLVALKLDVSKAYDRVEWSFLRLVMQKLGFPEKWINLVMHCVSSVSLSVLINGVASEKIFPKRGLRQGCPLSPYLFILCGEALSSLIMLAEYEKRC